MSIMNLAVACGEKINVTAHGSDAEQAVKELTQAIKDGLGEDCPPISGTDDTGPLPGATRQLEEPEPDVGPASGDPNLLLGGAASPGLAIGVIVQLRHDDVEVEEFASDHHVETRSLNRAIDRALLDLSALQHRVAEESPEQAEIFGAHQEILSDPDLLDLAKSLIDKGKSAAFAWRSAYTDFADRLAGSKNLVLAGRSADVRDVGARVLAELTGSHSQEVGMPENSILVAEEITPSYIAQIDRSKVTGIVTTNGGVSSHVAILARSMDIPSIAGIEARALEIPQGEKAILDGSADTFKLGASDEEINQIIQRQKRMAECRANDEARKDEPAITRDGHQIQVVSNIGGVEDAREAVNHGSEGVGLLRSEFIFMGRSAVPPMTSSERSTPIA